LSGAPAILFDLDGTLVDSEPGVVASFEAALLTLGHRPQGLDVRALIGPPLEETMGLVLGRFGDDRVDEAVLAYRAHYGSTGFLATTVYPGVVDMLERLRALDARLYVATSKRTVFARPILESLGLIGMFSAVHGSEPGGAMDHKAELIADLLARHALEADRCLMVGDRRQDVAGAQANGVAALGVLWGYGDRAELEAAGAQRIISRPGDLAAIVEDRLKPA
jgi:phosphoglycolate phosphatase